MLFAGTNYHPHDWPEERWLQDISLMKEASFNLVRLGHLCWDSFEPSEGHYTFEWFDKIMQLFHEAGIRVVLDIATRPAPLWLHKKYPEIDITDRNGIRLHAQSRYMEDTGHPVFREYAYRFAEQLVSRYRRHPALYAFGLCNELGAGMPSFSESVKERFIGWLKNRYGTIDSLNRAWSSQRWSRKLNSFHDIALPVSGNVKGAPERMLDLWRFYSDETLEYMYGLSRIVKRLAPDARETTNHWAENAGFGFDYLKRYEETIDIPGVGFYPGTNPEDRRALMGACFFMSHRIGELDKPIWCLEFQTGDYGGYGSPRKAMRMYAYLSLLFRSQAICAWTWRSMLGGEEQYLFGLVDHDGTPGWKYTEFKQIAEEFKLLRNLPLPRITAPDIGLAYSFESLKVMNGNKGYYKTDYMEQVLQAYETIQLSNLDCSVVDLRQMRSRYKLLLIPGHALLDRESAETIRTFVRDGGTVVMTAYSAKVDEHNRVFDSPAPGRLDDLFGIRVGAFNRTWSHTPGENAGGVEKTELRLEREKPSILWNGDVYKPEIAYYEILELRGAEEVARFIHMVEESPAVTRNKHGKGQAIYMAIPAETRFLHAFLQSLYPVLGISPGPVTPPGVCARQLQDGSVLYVNTTPKEQTVMLDHPAEGLLTQQSFGDTFKLDPYDVEFIRRSGGNRFD